MGGQPTIEYGAGSAATDAANVSCGKGLDVGTANLLAAQQDAHGNVLVKSQRNAFIDIEQNDFTRNMLTRMGVQYVILSGKMIVIGDPAFDLANIYNRETRRPMADGMISPKEADAMPIEKLLVDRLLGPPQKKGEICYFSIPGKPLDFDMDVSYHRNVFRDLLGGLGYEAKPIHEGYAVVLSELDEDPDLPFTGIGVSCGGGMFNICVAYQAIETLAFATTRGGDWVDQNVGRVLGIKASRATAMKEKGIDLRNPRTREEQAIDIYYRELIRYALTQTSERFSNQQDTPNFPQPVDMVFAGGTSRVGGFIDVVRDELSKMDFPIPIRNVLRAEDPLTSVARGCLVAAAADGEA
jgi:hypothetical protein